MARAHIYLPGKRPNKPEDPAKQQDKGAVVTLMKVEIG
jgi:hypothetical protein